MDIKQNPFSLYDFLGYFVPGALLLFALYGSLQIAISNTQFLQVLTTIFQPSKLEFYIPFVLASYLVGHALSFISSVTIEKYSVWRVGYPSGYLLGGSYPKYFHVASPKITRIIVRLFVGLFLFPISFVDITLGQLLKLNDLFARPLDNILLDKLPGMICKFLKQRISYNASPKKIKDGSIEYFRLIYHSNVEYAPAHLPKMQNYVALYGFCRTISLILLILFWLTIFAIFRGYIPIQSSIISMVILGFLSYLFYLDFLKFYRRFSLEVLMAFSTTFAQKMNYPTPADSGSTND